MNDKPIDLVAVFQPMAGFHLTETPVANDQELTQLKDGTYQLKVSLPDTSQLRWWLLGFGEQVEIKSPKGLRKEFKEKILNMKNIYT